MTNSIDTWNENHRSWANASHHLSIINAILEIHKYIEQKPPYYEIDISMQLTSIWKNLIVNGIQLEYVQTEIVKGHRMKQMLSYIHQHYPEKMMLEDIARAGQLSRSECCRYFKRYLNSTPLNMLRIIESKKAYIYCSKVISMLLKLLIKLVLIVQAIILIYSEMP